MRKHDGLIKASFPEPFAMERDWKDEVGFGQGQETGRRPAKSCQCCQAVQIFSELEAAYKRGDRIFVKNGGPGKLKGGWCGKAFPAEVVITAFVRNTAEWTLWRSDEMYICEAVVTKKRQFPTGQLPLAGKTI